MNWHNEFRSTFFSIWTSTGFPQPCDFEEAYSNRLKHYSLGKRYDINSSPHSPLDAKLLDRIYGFGVFIGEVIGSLLGLSGHEAKQRADWCGRFNLGISLFDYICDESRGLKIVSTIPAFQFFFDNSFSTYLGGLGQTEKFLNNLTISILSDVEQEESASIAGWKTEFVRVMKKMFDAECRLSSQHLNEECTLAQIRKDLYLKSVEPFRIMAEWMSHDRLGSDKSTRRSAIELGRALGCCYWLIDDAKDVWLDLESNRWNLFLIRAAEEEPKLFERSRNAITDFKLTKIWEHNNIVHRLSMSTICRLFNITTQLKHKSRKRRESLGLLGASLARW